MRHTKYILKYKRTQSGNIWSRESKFQQQNPKAHFPHQDFPSLGCGSENWDNYYAFWEITWVETVYYTCIMSVLHFGTSYHRGLLQISLMPRETTQFPLTTTYSTVLVPLDLGYHSMPASPSSVSTSSFQYSSVLCPYSTWSTSSTSPLSMALQEPPKLRVAD